MPLVLALLLAAWLGMAQVAVAAHDAVHHTHAHVDLCDMLSTQGNGPALLASTVNLALPARLHDFDVSALPAFFAATPWPAFHSRAPPR